MPDAPPPNVKIYDRPERTGPSPIVLVIIVLVIALVGYFAYKAFYHPAAAPQHSMLNPVRVQPAFWQEGGLNGTQSIYRLR